MTEIKAVPQFTQAEIDKLLEKREDCTHVNVLEGFCLDCHLHLPTYLGSVAMKVEWEAE